MTTISPPSSYAFQTHTGLKPALIVPEPEPPLSPRQRALVIGIRAALLALCDALGEFAGLPKRA